jgi:general secretion pathway protein G
VGGPAFSSNRVSMTDPVSRVPQVSRFSETWDSTDQSRLGLLAVISAIPISLRRRRQCRMKLVVLKRAFVLGLRGFTLVELIVATAILVILTGLAVPLARVAIKREKERELRTDLWELRDAIDRYKDTADRGAFQIKVGSEGYPPDLDTLVKGVDVGGKKMRFLRCIPTDPMTNSTEWGLRSMQDDPASDSWGGQNVFDVFTKAQGTGLDGTEYKDW